MPLPGKWKLEDILTISYLKDVNSTIIKTAIDNYNSLEHLMDSRLPPAMSSIFNQLNLFGRPLAEASRVAKQQIDTCGSYDVDIISIWDDDYPALLKEISLPPVLLFVKGRLQPPDSIAVSIVGKRNCTDYGEKVAEKFAKAFVDKNIIVCSGLARGIDTISHKAVIDEGGITYAVIASGIDKISPLSSKDFAEDVVSSGGAVISEYPCGTVAKVPYFPSRNRIISGISKASLVVESAEKGGSLITAKFAFEQFREVYAVPGNITSPESVGCNNLIKNNVAKAVQSPDDIFSDLGIEASTGNNLQPKRSDLPEMSGNESQIYNLIDSKTLNVDEIAMQSGIDISELSVILLNMELKGLVKTLPGNNYTLK